MESMKGDLCDLCLNEIVDTKGTYRDDVFSICAICVKIDNDNIKLKEKQSDSRIITGS